ncbi:hypothetical protein [Xanthovirga aplysinae]|uniref:hypothetical protein n=1 Tax=Xanthovirga aplysinae TaxID=2529853 RepID=UPI0012BCBA46|nr:hypothetical protein [Xanthovirga aplysinae]MTI31417.1 hypothetical protein [Xanthovirga aplysinae]
MEPTFKYIGKQITIKKLRDFIIDNKLTENDSILLHTLDFDNIVLEYKEFYKESLIEPFLILNVLIKEDARREIPFNRIGILKNDFRSVRTKTEINYDLYEGEVAYRCGLCGNIIDDQGNDLIGPERERIINYLEKFPNPTVKHKLGKCCPNPYE